MMLALLLMAETPPTGTITTGADYLRQCSAAALGAGVDGKLLSVTCVSFVNGYVRGAAYTESMKAKPAYCLTAEAGTDDVMAAIEAHLTRDPAGQALPIEQVIVATLAERYPCK